ncbi:unnamed protein product [Camellia sinensis]
MRSSSSSLDFQSRTAIEVSGKIADHFFRFQKRASLQIYDFFLNFRSSSSLQIFADHSSSDFQSRTALLFRFARNFNYDLRSSSSSSSDFQSCWCCRSFFQEWVKFHLCILYVWLQLRKKFLAMMILFHRMHMKFHRIYLIAC